MRDWDALHAEIIGEGLLAEYSLDAACRAWADWLFDGWWRHIVAWPPFQMVWPRWQVAAGGTWTLPPNPLIAHLDRVTMSRINEQKAFTLVDLFKRRQRASIHDVLRGVILDADLTMEYRQYGGPGR